MSYSYGPLQYAPVGCLDGPGPFAYQTSDVGGIHSTDYEYEKAYGGVYARSTRSDFAPSGTYTYHRSSYYKNGDTGDGHSFSGTYRRVDYSDYNSDFYGYDAKYVFGSGRSPAETGALLNYSTQDTYHSASQSAEYCVQTTFTSTYYTNGANESSYASLTEALSGGHVVPGSYDSHRVSAYTTAAGYSTYAASDVMR